MRIIEDTKLDYSDVLIVPKKSSLESRKEVILEREYKFLHTAKTHNGVGLISANMDHTGTIEMAGALGEFNVMTALHKHYDEETLVSYFAEAERNNTFYSLGISERDFQKFKTVYERTNGAIDKLCIDVANGYTEQFKSFISKVRAAYPDVIIMAGSVVTPEITEQLLLAGADIIRVGIGSGSVCTTRKLTGVGYPQLSAVIECADAAHGIKGMICADGGCQMPGDLAKAFGAGADFTMLGGMLAGHHECQGQKIAKNKKAIVSEVGTIEINTEVTHMKFYGMSSAEAMGKYAGGVAEYRAAEGKSILIPYRGNVENTIREILGGLRSACTYTGSMSLKELHKRCTFIKVQHTHNTIFGDEK